MYSWYTSQGVTARLGWPRLKATMLAYFKSPDYAFKARQELSSWKQRGNVTDYVMGFLQRLNECTDVDENEVLYRFVEGLKPEVQRWVRNAKPSDLADATQTAKEVGSTL